MMGPIKPTMFHGLTPILTILFEDLGIEDLELSPGVQHALQADAQRAYALSKH